MARAVEGFHSFVCALIYRPLRDGRLSWLRPTVASKQSAQDRYVKAITAVSRSSLNASLGN